MVNVTLSQARSGGASAGRGYLKELIEIDMDGVFFTGKYFAMASAGVIYHIPMLCGYSAEDLVNMLISIGGDKYQRIDPAKIKNPIEYLKWSFGIRRKFYKDAEEVAKKNFTWEKLMECGRLSSKSRPLIAMTKFSDCSKVIKSDLLSDMHNGKLDNPIEVMFDGEARELRNLLPPYFFSYDGVYSWEYSSKSLIKVSDKVTPLWQCYMMAFANFKPFGKIYTLDFGGKKKERPFDGGICCNFANLFGEEYQLIACEKIPTKEELDIKKGIASISYYNYLEMPAIKECPAYPLTGGLLGFYDISDEVIAHEYEAARAVWRVKKYFS